MKVLILITKSNWGGAQRYVYDIAVNLPKTDYEVEVMAGGNGLLIEKLHEVGIKADGSLPIGRNINFTEDIKAFVKLIKILKEKKPDILHINSSKIGALGAIAGKLTGIKKIIFTAHGWAFNENRSFISKSLLKLVYWIIILISNKTIAVSENTKNQISTWPYMANKIVVVHNGIKPEIAFSKINAKGELAKINEKFKDILKINKNITIIGSIGELHHIKGYNYSIKAIHELIEHNTSKKIVYLIIGNGEEKENIEKLIKDLKLENNVIMFGYVPQAYQYLKAFDIFLLPSLSEGFPYIALEAGNAGLPVVATAVGGIPEIIEDMHSGILIQSKKPREIRHAVEFYMSHKKVQKEYGVTLNKKISEEFTIKKMISETVGIYHK
jgi:glycosyltransferase involved in cell wall biosynthesis